jgi:diacylglycerol kinase (ATP)
VSTNIAQWHFLINPAAGGWKGGGKWRRLLPRLQTALPAMTWAESTSEEGMVRLAEKAVRSGKIRLVGVGGDGTHHEVVNGIVAAGGLGTVTYCPLSMGSGNDWVRTLGTPKNIDHWLEMLRKEKTLEHGVGRLIFAPSPPPKVAAPPTPFLESLSNQAGATRGKSKLLPPASSDELTRYFINVAGMAYDAEVVRRADASRFKNRWIYPLMTLAFLRHFTAPTVRVDYDGKTWTGPVHTINLGIGRYSGGGMRLVPQANPEAETLALTFAKELSLWKILAESWRFYAGSIGKVKGVTLTEAKSVTVTTVAGNLELEADGEWLGYGPVSCELLKERLRVVVNFRDT